MFMKKAFAAVLATAVLVAGAVEAKDLRVASNTTFPPFEFVNTKTQEITGFEMDLIRAMGKQAGYEVKITNMAFDGIIPAVLSGSVDVGASGFSVTEERKKRVLYSDTFYTSGLSLVTTKAKAGAVKSMKDLEGKTIGVQIGTTSHNAAKKVKGIRACCCSDSFSCEYTRRHNDANALCMGGRVVGAGLACQLVDIFLNTEFEGGRHQRRIDKLTALENR